jgi:hypothetical protein
MCLLMVQLEQFFSVPKLSWELDRQFIDSTISSTYTEKISSFKICVGKGFSRRWFAFIILVGPLNKHTAWQLHPCIHDYLLCISNVYTSLQQVNEWGMGRMQGTFPWCKKLIPTNSLKGRRVLESIVLIHNFRTKVVGSNHIKTVFDSKYEWYTVWDDRMSQYYFLPWWFESSNDGSV